MTQNKIQCGRKPQVLLLLLSHMDLRLDRDALWSLKVAVGRVERETHLHVPNWAMLQLEDGAIRDAEEGYIRPQRPKIWIHCRRGYQSSGRLSLSVLSDNTG